ncbi:MAG: hypothetical protein EXR62_03810 [Chloroflexi bacterium]|nr:hypothetical protein [Chloroflexota bacterium]
MLPEKPEALPTSGFQHLATYPLLDALIGRRSRRFATGLHLAGDPLDYASAQPTHPLSLAEEAALAFAGCGVSGYALGELPYRPGPLPESGSGYMMTHFFGRTVASADALHTVILFVINDQGAWMLKRPQDFPRSAIPDLIQAAQEHRLVDLYEQSRIRLADHRLDVPRQIPYVPSFNKWSANLPGTTYFLPVNELTALYINFLLAAFGEEFAYFAVDERNNFQPAGLAKFARSKGGYLHDDPAEGRFGTVAYFEHWLCEFVAVEQGAILQNLGLMSQALGLGGFPHFAAHPFGWFQTLGFRMTEVPISQATGASLVMKMLLKGLKKDIPMPTAVGLEHNGEPLIKPFCPPYYRNMEDAVLSYIDYKFAQGKGTYRDGGVTSGWRDGAAIQAGIPRYSDRTIAATIAYCDYVYRHYGRFPAVSGPFRTILAYQAHHLDLDFYDKFYRPETITAAQRDHDRDFHATG